MANGDRKLLYYAIYALILLLGVFGGFVIFDRLLMPAFTRGGGTLTIPDITGIPAGDAEQIAKKGGFDFLVMREEHNDSVPEGYIISQRPTPGSPAKKGRRISVVVSLSEALAVVPDVAGQHYRSAMLDIEKAGLQVRDTVFEHSDSVDREMIIGTSPEIGEELILGSSVDIIVSMGAERGLVKVPNFMGQTLDDAKSLAQSEGLILLIQYRKIPSVPEKTVYRQGTDPGTLVERGNSIYVVVARSEEE
ncbi:MAG: PASTA domain-containing protein [bacterium]